ncbi:uncharacterized protein cubi_02381 [Cryptosporidium ubiquitum]|uniref:Uncharacterized protein n=1 Tax=Cryptosporidium ubiquitum TaxID=857276 RepID=A0A1J4MJX4_9CRYT|nr:uncharacterized protein cubi_02381 [Cryptosporidium ubiquitum]OII73149.1 hypothetical protein cubi_02381 [Cryptosporidium ubiquitum]
MDEIRRQIEDLMGGIEAPIEKKDPHDNDVCKFYLCGLCPHELFENTKLYMGPCKNIHSEVLRKKYLSEREIKGNTQIKYETESLKVFQGMVDDCNKKIERNRVRAELSGSSKLEDENIRALDLEIKEIMKEIDDLGANGDIDGSLKRMEDLTRLNQQKMKISATKEDVENGMYRQKLHPCEICAAFLSETDNDQRLNDHFNGKIHVGYLKIRKQAKDLKEWLKIHSSNRNDNYRHEGITHRGDTRYKSRRQSYSGESRAYHYLNNYRDRRHREHLDYRDQYGSHSYRRERNQIRYEEHGNYYKKSGPNDSNYPEQKNKYLDYRSNPYSASEPNRINLDNYEKLAKTNEKNYPPSDGEISPESDSSHSLSRSISPC